jgi:hypothetical protein
MRLTTRLKSHQVGHSCNQSVSVRWIPTRTVRGSHTCTHDGDHWLRSPFVCLEEQAQPIHKTLGREQRRMDRYVFFAEALTRPRIVEASPLLFRSDASEDGRHPDLGRPHGWVHDATISTHLMGGTYREPVQAEKNPCPTGGSATAGAVCPLQPRTRCDNYKL